MTESNNAIDDRLNEQAGTSMIGLSVKSSLKSSQCRLVELIQQINFGLIDRLQVRDGQPVLDPPPRIVQKVKLGGDGDRGPVTTSEDYLLKSQVIELLATIAGINDGEVLRIEVKHGLPFSMEIEHRRDGSGGFRG